MRATRTQAALRELIAQGPSVETSQMVGELNAADKLTSSLTALIPFVGPWLIQRSEAHTPSEKRTLSWLSIGLTAIAAWVVVSRLPPPSDQLAKLHSRIDGEIQNLADFANQYRAEHSSYPNKAAWSGFANRADPRFFDPWGRRYLYSFDAGSFTIGTLGRDGGEGGEDEDADISKSFPRSPEP